MPVVIFVTAYDRHALRAFEVHALDYVLKPVDPARLRDALERAASAIATRRSSSLMDRLEALMASHRPPSAEAAAPAPDRFAVRDGERTCLLEPASIDWFESAGNWVRVHSAGHTYTMRSTMNDVARRLASRAEFVRIRRSVIVHVGAIASLERYGKGTFLVRLRDGGKVVSSRFYVTALRRLLKPPA
jgi:two-component system LytT family response regulator